MLSWSHQRCEAWDITKYEEAGRFKNQWKCNCIPPWGVTGDREVAYAVTVSVNQAGSVQWTLSAGFAAI